MRLRKSLGEKNRLNIRSRKLQRRRNQLDFRSRKFASSGHFSVHCCRIYAKNPSHPLRRKSLFRHYATELIRIKHFTNLLSPCVYASILP
nr:MAG TPA: hypothetical protein [Caudoviricetes sp.]